MQSTRANKIRMDGPSVRVELTVAPFSTAARRTRRPMRPNPLMPIFDMFGVEGEVLLDRLAGNEWLFSVGRSRTVGGGQSDL
jgi:hypothetical protein